MENEITLQDIERRLAALEITVASLTAEKNKGGHSDEPRGKFSHIGGKCILKPSDHPTAEKPIDFSSIGGVCVRKAPDSKYPEE